jgi:hypothetical protein
MTLEFREKTRKQGRKKLRELDVFRISPNFELRVATIRPDCNELEPVSFERFTVEETLEISGVMANAVRASKAALRSVKR